MGPRRIPTAAAGPGDGLAVIDIKAVGSGWSLDPGISAFSSPQHLVPCAELSPNSTHSMWSAMGHPTYVVFNWRT